MKLRYSRKQAAPRRPCSIALRVTPAVTRLTVYRRPQALLYEPLLYESFLYESLSTSCDFTYGLKYCATSHFTYRLKYWFTSHDHIYHILARHLIPTQGSRAIREKPAGRSTFVRCCFWAHAMLSGITFRQHRDLALRVTCSTSYYSILLYEL